MGKEQVSGTLLLSKKHRVSTRVFVAVHVKEARPGKAASSQMSSKAVARETESIVL